MSSIIRTVRTSILSIIVRINRSKTIHIAIRMSITDRSIRNKIYWLEFEGLCCPYLKERQIITNTHSLKPIRYDEKCNLLWSAVGIAHVLRSVLVMGYVT